MDNSPVDFRLLSVTDIPMSKEMIIDDGVCYDPKRIEKFITVDGNLFGAIMDGKIIGLIYGYSLCQISKRKPQFFIYSVAVHSTYQNKGYGN